MEFYNEKIVTARTEHKCECCGKTIAVGEKYCRQNGKWEGDFFSRAYCITCDGVVGDYCCEVDNEFDYEAVADHAQEKFCQNCPNRNRDTDEECELFVISCPKVIEYYKQRFDKAKEKEE